MGAGCSKPKKVIAPTVIRVAHKTNQVVSIGTSADESCVKNPKLTYLGGEDGRLSARFNSELQEHSQKAGPVIHKEMKVGEYFLTESIITTSRPSNFNQSKPIKPKTKKKKQLRSIASKIRKIEAIIAKTKKLLTPTQLKSITDHMYSESDACIDHFSKLKPLKFEALLLANPPMKYRWAFWKAKLNIEQFYVENLYEKFLNLTSEAETSIRLDVHRTFPEEAFFATASYGFIGQSQLFNVLKAISIYFPTIGYCQGMNFIVGIHLLINGGKELEAFWFFITMARSHEFMIMGLFEPGFPLLKLLVHIFYETFKKEYPVLYEHMTTKVNLPDMVWISKWILVLFLYSLPAEKVVRAWDYIISEDIFALLKLSLGLLKFLEDYLMKVDMTGFNELLKRIREPEKEMKDSKASASLKRYANVDMDVVIANAKKIKLTKEVIGQLAKSFLAANPEQGQNNIYLRFFMNYESNSKDKEAIEAFQREVDYRIIETTLVEKKAVQPKQVESRISHQNEGGNMMKQMATIREDEKIEEEKNNGDEEEESEGEVQADGEEHHRPRDVLTQVIQTQSVVMVRSQVNVNSNDLKNVDNTNVLKKSDRI